MHQTPGAFERHRSAGRRAAAAQERGDTACAIAALFNLGTVGVEDPIEGGGTGVPRLLQHQRLIKAYARVTRRQALPQFARWREPRNGRVEYDEVVAEAMHFREVHAHDSEEYLNPIRVPRHARAYRTADEPSIRGSHYPARPSRARQGRAIDSGCGARCRTQSSTQLQVGTLQLLPCAPP